MKSIGSTRTIIQTALLTAGIALLVIGVLQGEARVVFQKAIRVCMECIGIG